MASVVPLREQLIDRVYDFFSKEGSRRVPWQNQVYLGAGYGCKACYFRVIKEGDTYQDLSGFWGEDPTTVKWLVILT